MDKILFLENDKERVEYQSNLKNLKINNNQVVIEVKKKEKNLFN